MHGLSKAGLPQGPLLADCVEKVPAARRRDRLIREPNAPRNDGSLNGG
jgi:hypothetical protein